jgi:hypothetical protein
MYTRIGVPQTAHSIKHVSLHSSNRLDFVTDSQRVYCGVRHK